MALLSAFFLLIAAHAWSGFQYRFTPSGLEISTLGFRLRSIPLAQIADYRPEKWMALRGYGFVASAILAPMFGATTWFTSRTHDGEVFLGHTIRRALVRDLDQMKQFTHS